MVSRRRFGYLCLKGLKKDKHLMTGARQQQMGAHRASHIQHLYVGVWYIMTTPPYHPPQPPYMKLTKILEINTNPIPVRATQYS